jgi:hypothetical protein
LKCCAAKLLPIHLPRLNNDFKECAALLNGKGVDCLVVGGYALAAHGHPRYTGDIDF